MNNLKRLCTFIQSIFKKHYVPILNNVVIKKDPIYYHGSILEVDYENKIFIAQLSNDLDALVSTFKFEDVSDLDVTLIKENAIFLYSITETEENFKFNSLLTWNDFDINIVSCTTKEFYKALNE